MKVFLLLVLLLPLNATAKIYKSIDANGNTVYTDIPDSKDAEALDLPNLNITSTPKRKHSVLDQSKRYSSDNNKSHLDRNYKSIKITKPKNEDTIRNGTGNVIISVSLDPPLQSDFGDRLIVQMDGVTVNNSNASSVTLRNVDRGSHQITAKVQNQKNPSINKVTTATFYLKRPSVKK